MWSVISELAIISASNQRLGCSPAEGPTAAWDAAGRLFGDTDHYGSSALASVGARLVGLA